MNRKDRALRTLLLSLLMLLLCAGMALAAPDQEIRILYTNDVHCGVEDHIGYAGVALYKKEMLKETPYVALVDAGDAIQGAPIGSLTEGRGIIRIMNAVGYDAAVPGNHEFDYGMDSFFRRAKELKCGYISCNMMDLRKNEQVFPSSKMLRFGDTRVALVGVCTPETITTSTPVYFQDGEGNYIYDFLGGDGGVRLYERVQTAVDEVREQGADYVILLAHLGNTPLVEGWSSQALIRNTSGIDAVIDGHSHAVEPEDRLKNKEGEEVILTQTGTKLNNIGRLTIDTEGNLRTELIDSVPALEDGFTWTVRPGDTLSAIARRKLGTWARWPEILEANSDKVSDPKKLQVGTVLTVPTTSFRIGEGEKAVYGDYRTWSLLQEIQADFEDVLGTVLAHTDFDLAATAPDGSWLVRNGETNLGDLLTDSLRAELGADIAMMGGGAIRAGIPAGDITYRDSLRVQPFGNMISSVAVTGQTILDVLEMGAASYPENAGCFLHVSGMSYTIDSSVPSSAKKDESGMFLPIEGPRRVTEVLVNGEPLDPEKTYVVAGQEYLLLNKGDGIIFAEKSQVVKDAVAVDLDCLTRYLAGLGGTVPEEYRDPAGQGRITIK